MTLALNSKRDPCLRQAGLPSVGMTNNLHTGAAQIHRRFHELVHDEGHCKAAPGVLRGALHG